MTTPAPLGMRERVAAKMTTLADLALIEDTCWEILDRPHYLVRDGQVVTGPNGQPVNDPEPAAEAHRLLTEAYRVREQITGQPAA